MTTHVVWACDQNGRRTITAERALHCHLEGESSLDRQPKTWMSASKKMLQGEMKAYSKQWNLQETELHSVDLCQHHLHRKMMDDKEEEKNSESELSA